MKLRWMMIILTASLCLFGCEEAKKEPTVSVNDTLKQYLNAMKQQDGLTMASLTDTGQSYDFAIGVDEAKALGMSQELAQKLYDLILDFEYTLSPETLHGEAASIEVQGKTYSIQKLLDQAVEAHKEEFEKINAEDIKDEEKNQKIARIIVDSFAESEKDAAFSFTFHLRLIDQEWRVVSVDEEAFLAQLFQMEES